MSVSLQCTMRVRSIPESTVLKMSASSEQGKIVVSGFTVLPVKFSAKVQACHYLYVKAHAAKEATQAKPRGKTLIILNVPPYCTEACLEHVFSRCGKVKQVFLSKRPQASAPPSEQSQFFKTVAPVTGFKVAYIVFTKDSSVQKAQNLPFDEPLILSTPEHPLVTGIAKWCQEYKDSWVDGVAMQTEIDSYMEEFDRKVAQEQQQEKEQEGEPDEEGWIKVTRQGHNKGIPRTEAQEKRITAKERHKRKQKELLNFYTFQMKDSKKEYISALRQKFEEDKQRIALMKAARRFRPY